ncbi:hypothetical protein Z946_1354 [Sulfitobacter noctilucicola]|uniref:Lipoprotein n=1 Tax=Sulfitobacter noctilucicola TaxID=1342301 RepID=A0A7W6M5Y6_9RHOB|nr:hypothetical protein [Sulfitobacter noctilucicola]KIN62494.1 hypothetical protein Z946_1354 [Sulfitobacter noctilucicola]MBB4172976.1 hypothetical protein [Sulfitobacter noctilucicola]
MRFMLFLLALMAPVPALALSCLAPSVERSFAQFDAAEEVYIVVHGRLTFDPDQLPEGMTQDPLPPNETLVPARLKGLSLTHSGFTLPFDQELTLEVQCAGPWCGGAQTGEDVLAYLRKDDGAYFLAISPCGGSVFGTPRPAMLKKVQRCLAGAKCEGR